MPRTAQQNTPQQDAPQGAGATPAAVPSQAAAAAQVVVPTTVEEVRAIKAQREQLSDQLLSAQKRFRSWTQDLEDGPSAAAPHIQQNLKVLGDRIVQLETDMAYTGRQLSLTRSDLLSSTAEPPKPFLNIPPEDFARISTTFSLFVLAPIAFAFARLIWKRATSTSRVTVHDSDGPQRLKRVEQAVDAIAIEVERISEGQRFLTQLFANEQRHTALASGESQAAPVARR